MRRQISHLLQQGVAGKFATAVQRIAGARHILQKFENLKKQHE
jgi:hypothetical protein